MLLIHTLLLSLVFGGEGTGRPGFGFLWQERRIEAPDLRLVLVPAQVKGAGPVDVPVAEPLLRAPIEQHASGGPAPMPLSIPPPLARATQCGGDLRGGSTPNGLPSKITT